MFNYCDSEKDYGTQAQKYATRELIFRYSQDPELWDKMQAQKAREEKGRNLVWEKIQDEQNGGKKKDYFLEYYSNVRSSLPYRITEEEWKVAPEVLQGYLDEILTFISGPGKELLWNFCETLEKHSQALEDQVCQVPYHRHPVRKYFEAFGAINTIPGYLGLLEVSREEFHVKISNPARICEILQQLLTEINSQGINQKVLRRLYQDLMKISVGLVICHPPCVVL